MLWQPCLGFLGGSRQSGLSFSRTTLRVPFLSKSVAYCKVTLAAVTSGTSSPEDGHKLAVSLPLQRPSQAKRGSDHSLWAVHVLYEK